MDARTAVMKYMCPSLGAAIAFAMFISPFRAVLRVDREKQLGDLNPIPYTAMAANGMSWIAYGIVIHDFFVYGSNISGLLLGLFYVMTCYKYASDKVQDVMRALVLLVSAVFIVIALVHMGAGLDQHGNEKLWGSTAVGILAVYYVTPLTTLATVLRQRDSSSLQRPLLLANMANGVMWFCYGIAIGDWFLIAPNGIGAAFSLISLIISFLIPRSSSSSSSRRRGNGSLTQGSRINSNIKSNVNLLPIRSDMNDTNDINKAKPVAAAATAAPAGGRDYDAVCLPHMDQDVRK
eukprot:GHUV01001070.1.p1 GENE.GHUV01001070.1~~GHUV01001070.1.p1  ORF type:complete len:292 (+),score=74.63 GHUV01001070.1:289-1164(+)